MIKKYLHLLWKLCTYNGKYYFYRRFSILFFFLFFINSFAKDAEELIVVENGAEIINYTDVHVNTPLDTAVIKPHEIKTFGNEKKHINHKVSLSTPKKIIIYSNLDSYNAHHKKINTKETNFTSSQINKLICMCCQINLGGAVLKTSYSYIIKHFFASNFYSYNISEVIYRFSKRNTSRPPPYFI